MKKLFLLTLAFCLSLSASFVFAAQPELECDIFDSEILEPLDESDYEILFDKYDVESVEELDSMLSARSTIYRGYGKTTDSNVNLRKGPGTSYDSLGQLEKGTILLVYSDSSYPSWFEVWVESGVHDGKRGWVSRSYVDVFDPAR